MSRDVTYLLWYESQPYLDGFPQSVIEALNATLPMIRPFQAVPGVETLYSGTTKHGHDATVLEQSKATQVLACGDAGGGWYFVEQAEETADYRTLAAILEEELQYYMKVAGVDDSDPFVVGQRAFLAWVQGHRA